MKIISALLKKIKQNKQEKNLKKNYWEFISKLLNEHPGCISNIKAKEYESIWIKTKLSIGGPLEDGFPWVPFNAMEYMDKILNKESKVFEFGIGGSTIFFSKRVGELISVEHDKDWFERTKKSMQKLKEFKWVGYLKEPTVPELPIIGDGTDPYAYTTTDEEMLGQSFKNYVKTIDLYEDKYFDLILIDGRSRPSCFLHAISKIKDTGFIVLDNAEREAYKSVEVIAKSKNFEIEEFWGPGPYNDHGWRTIFIKKSSIKNNN